MVPLLLLPEPMEAKMQHVYVEERIKEAQVLSTQQLHVRIECEKELIEWREQQIARLQEDMVRANERLYAAAAVLCNREQGE